MDRVATALQRDGVHAGDVIALCGLTTPQRRRFSSEGCARGRLWHPSHLRSHRLRSRRCCATRMPDCSFHAAAAPLVPAHIKGRCIALEAGAPGTPFDDWLAAPGSTPMPVAVKPEWPFNIIYSSGTTGTPKGIVQAHSMRWAHSARTGYGYGGDASRCCPRHCIPTPRWSFFPALAWVAPWY